ncbi:MAG: Asp23/Gls24 family envelope stress response protein [Lachnospiraceae bacterium]|nr:Asp23/Gls24 family envelope stress response protein [Lachnospiraceae bacterium]MBP5264117.1 Asp23/Gls24 family envelope stress response protein [Lachnospiraceae bacterium]MBP5733019.1 Asp23/Gls24 family envelope stress response protein [Lachnospiraceae bacterium]MBR3470228.1 Asp23/Gls24 family envelope stress response protein [Lachnospiraceae bacterium]MCR5498826.1 Asp23/Gls24 family envelope stress response protein [Acetatifactor sp.]
MEKEQNAVVLKEEESVGAVRISETVVAHIASIAATEVEGVAPQGGTAKASKGVKVEIKNGKVRVELAVTIKYGFNIPEVSGQLQSKVKSAIENMTGLICEGVNVRFAGVIIK